MSVLRKTVAAVALLAASGKAQDNGASTSGSCSSTLTADYPAPSVADGYTARLVATDLTSPRGIKFDTKGNLLVIEEGVGVTAITFEDGGGSCVQSSSKDTVVTDDTLNHGIELSADGGTLYASNSDKLYSWNYSPDQRQTTSDAEILVQNMEGSDHTSRTLLLSESAPGMIVINRGSFENIDVEARDLSSGHGQVKAFDVGNSSTPLDFNDDGVLLGWGLRNDVGIGEDPNTGGIWSVENSADQMERSGEDIHQNNPAEKLNFLGYLDGQESQNQGENFGYPDCFAAWEADALPNFDGTTGDQFAPNEQNNTNNDEICEDRIAPRLAFQAHMAPLDIKFNSEGTQAWITFHGSWNREDPVGYKLSMIEWANGEPVEPSDSMTAATDTVSNPDLSECPGSCFRPVGLAWDKKGRLFMSSDATGEIYMIAREGGAGISSANATTTGQDKTNPTTSDESSEATTPNGAVARHVDSTGVLAILLCAFAFFA